MLDTSGLFIEMMNSFICKQIFMRAKSVRIVVPIAVEQIMESRGKGARDQMNVIQRILSNHTIDETIHSVQPLLTKVNLKDDTIDIDEMKSNLGQGLQKDLQKQKVQCNPDDSISQADAFESLNRFNNELAFKLEIFDPMDRAYEDKTEEEQPIKRDELLEVLK